MLYIELPSRDLLSGATFAVEIRPLFSVYLNEALLKFNVGDGLQMIDVTANEQAFETARTELNSGRTEVSALFASRKDDMPIEPQQAITNELLLWLNAIAVTQTKVAWILLSSA